MDILLFIKTVVMGIVEGLTEFLPVSSTGHLIVADVLMNYSGSIVGKEAAATFGIFIQLGATLAVVLYFVRDLSALLRRALHEDAARRVLLNLAVAFVPAAAIGFLAGDFIKDVLFSTSTVALALILGGLVMLWVEGRDHRSDTTDVERMSLRQALLVGLAQVAALIPGVSRSASTLIGGLFAGLDRSTALRFSFYLSIPTLGIATVYDFIKSRDAISAAALPYFVLGAAVAFVVALLVVRFFLFYVSRRDLKPFGWYRIIAGALLLAATATGLIG